MSRLIALILLAGAIPAHAQDDSPEAYRLDRIETQKLNQAAAAKLKPTSITPPAAAPTVAPPAPAPTPAEQALRMKEEQAIAAWRRRVTACEHGDKDACRSY